MKDHKSIFDEYFSFADLNANFNWTAFDESIVTPLPANAIIFEGFLREYYESTYSLSAEFYYILSKEHLLKFKVFL